MTPEGRKSCSSFHCKNEGRIMGGRVVEGRVCGRERKNSEGELSEIQREEINTFISNSRVANVFIIFLNFERVFQM